MQSPAGISPGSGHGHPARRGCRAPARREFEVLTAPDITAISRPDWDSSVARGPGSFYNSYAWLSTVAAGTLRGGEKAVRYVVVRHRDTGRLLCALPVYTIWQPGDCGLYDPNTFFGGLLGEHQRESAFPMTLIGSREGHFNLLPVADGQAGPAGGDVLAAALGAALETAPGAGAVVLPYLTTSALGRVRHCLRDWPLPPIFAAGYASMALTFADIPGYLHRFSSRRRREIAKELAWMRHLPAGHRLTTEPLVSAAGDVAPLILNVQRRHGAAGSEEHMRHRLERLAAACGDGAVAFCYRRGGRLVAAATAVMHAQDLYVRGAGLDYEAIKGTPAYFAVASYQSLLHALDARAGRIHMGLGAYRPKTLRGAHVDPLWTLCWTRDGTITPQVARAATERNVSAFLAAAGLAVPDGPLTDVAGLVGEGTL